MPKRLPLLRGRITSIDTYQAPQQGGSAPKVPSLDPKKHGRRLLQQLDEIERQIGARPAAVRDEFASREIVAVTPSKGNKLLGDQLDSVTEDARLVGVVPETGTVLLDVANPRLDYLREKVDAFADDTGITKKKEKDGTVTVHREAERAIAPVASIALAQLDDIRGPRLRAEKLVSGRAYWFEVACRGGYRCGQADNDASRAQIGRQLHRVGANQVLEEFVSAEQVYFYVRMNPDQANALLASTDCIYEVELAPPAIRDLRLLDNGSPADLKGFALIPPDADAPAVVILDTGIATGHPLLKDAILSATTAGELIPSPEDTHGHGTKMAGIALYGDLGGAIQRGGAKAEHWIQSSRLLVAPGVGTAADENYEKWPVLTLGAVKSAEEKDPTARARVFALAITRSMQVPPLDDFALTLWSHAVDQISYREGHGRLLVVSAGNARDNQWLALAAAHPQLQLSEKIHQPAQAANVLTVGAFTTRTTLPPHKDFVGAAVVAPVGGISPYTSTGPSGSEWAIKPDIVMEGGNLALMSGNLPNAGAPTLSALTTSHHHTRGSPLGLMSMTSEATARAARLAAGIWSVEPKLRPETVRGLLVHAASWTPQMRQDFSGINDRLQACGYGVPDEQFARECAVDRATVIIEDSMPSGVFEQAAKKKPPKRKTTKTTEPKLRRKNMLYRVPIPEALIGDDDPTAELRVTLSYFAEPNRFGSRAFRGLELKWDMQGPQESEPAFLRRINVLHRPEGADGKRQKVPLKDSFPWEVGIQRRGRGTVQSDRWSGRMSLLAGSKLVAVMPVLGWWDRRRDLRTEQMRFSLLVSVVGPGVYAAIKPLVELPVETQVHV